MPKTHRAILASILVLASWTGLDELRAAPLERQPGATLVIPYFEVDLDEPDGRTTLISLTGSPTAPVLAHATIWSDWGVPVYSWDIVLGPGAAANYNLRDILVHGNLAAGAFPAGAFPGCASPLENPALDVARVALLQKQLTGLDLGGGLCAGAPRADATLASGSLTIDTVTSCSGPLLKFPVSPGYFDGAPPLASASATLWGDFVLLDPAENFAEGYSAFAFAIDADPGQRGFGGWPASAEVKRQDLPDGCNRMRFLQNGPFAAKTALFVYTAPPVDSAPAACAIPGPYSWYFRSFDPTGAATPGLRNLYTHRTSARLDTAADLGVAFDSGFLEVKTGVFRSGIPFTQPTSHLLFGNIQASGRFAAGVAGTPAVTACHP